MTFSILPNFNILSLNYGLMGGISPFCCNIMPNSIFSGFSYYNPFSSLYNFAFPMNNYFGRYTSAVATASKTAKKASKKITSQGASNTTMSAGITIGSNQNATTWEKLGYCAKSGMKLAKNALASAVGFIGYCCKYVKNAIAKSGMGEYVSGHAYQMVSIMRNNKKFKEINPTGVDVKKLPAGCVLVYGKKVAGYSPKYGHVELTTGDGRCVSDGITRNPRNNPTAIFIPISA